MAKMENTYKWSDSELVGSTSWADLIGSILNSNAIDVLATLINYTTINEGNLFKTTMNISQVADLTHTKIFEYINNTDNGNPVPINYELKTNEHVFTGNFFNGKKIYCYMSSVDITQTTTALILGNVDTLITFTGTIISGGDAYLIPFWHNTSKVDMMMTKNQIKISSNKIGKVDFTIEYTKVNE